MKLPVILIAGRTNVGKTTLFNRLVEENKGAISSIKHTTRDITEGEVVWRQHRFLLLDSGGWDVPRSHPHAAAMKQGLKRALTRADMILFTLDARAGILPQDRTIARSLTAQKKPVVAVVNKTEGAGGRALAAEFERLGVGRLISVSALSGSGTGELLDAVIALMPAHSPDTDTRPTAPRIAIVGKTNVGKSSLLNALTGEEHMIVSPIPHTTLEPHDTLITHGERAYTIIDTVGLRRKLMGRDDVALHGENRTRRVIREANVILFLLDPLLPPTANDSSIAHEIFISKKPVLIVVNKWDEVPTQGRDATPRVRTAIYGDYPFLDFAPIVFVSAKTRMRVTSLFSHVDAVLANYEATIPDDRLAQWLGSVPLPRTLNAPRPVSLTQTGSMPPTFTLTLRAKLAPPYAFYKYMERRLRTELGLRGTPITLVTEFVK